MSDTIQEVWEVNQPGEGTWKVGRHTITKIELVADGNGLSGYYDRIHIYRGDRRHITLPAWCCGWRYSDD